MTGATGWDGCQLEPMGATLIGVTFAIAPLQIAVTDATVAGTDALTFDPESTGPRTLAWNGSVWLFGLTTPSTGSEFWITDGTAAGTFCLDLVTGPGGSRDTGTNNSGDGYEAAVFGGRFYFSAWTPDRGFEIWENDGNPEGTFPLPEILPGPAGFERREGAHVFGDRLFVAVNGGDGAGRELWSLSLAQSIFADGFESGDTTNWNATLPESSEAPGSPILTFRVAPPLNPRVSKPGAPTSADTAIETTTNTAPTTTTLLVRIRAS